jgi:SAM-dependent methyltransferase
LNLIEEYLRQQPWRHWEQYLARVPVQPGDHVLDLGCSVGGMAGLLTQRAGRVTGLDLNPDFIAHCAAARTPRQEFLCADFAEFDYAALAPVNGIWSSFALSYLPNPGHFLRRLHKCLQPGGWIALADVSCFISGNMALDSRHQEAVQAFELASGQSGLYDFDFGSKMAGLLQAAGFGLVHVDDDVPDTELNFTGAAIADVERNWRARLARMQGLRNHFGAQYEALCGEILAHLRAPTHAKRRNVRFVVATKD